MTLPGLNKLDDDRSRRIATGKIAELLERSGIDVADIGRIEKVRVNSYQALTKDADGVAQIHDLEASSVLLSPKWADGPAWPVVAPAAPCSVPPVAAKMLRDKQWKTAVILPDPQIGFRRFEDATLDPFHDEKAMSVALQIMASLEYETGVDLVVNLGDFVDFPMFGKFVQEPAFAQTTQAALDRGHRFLAQQRATCPGARNVVIEGNHDRRMTNAIVQNAAQAFGIKVANAPESWPVLSVPYLLRFDELGIEYVEGYPAGEFWVNDRLVAIHGRKVKSGGSTAAAVVRDETVSQLFGHIHRLEMQHRTVRRRSGPVHLLAATPGCLCVPLDTQILSDRGWLTHDQVAVGDRVLGHKAGQLEWTDVTAVVHYADAPLVQMNHPQFNAVCTPDHRWVVERRRGGNLKRTWHQEMETAAEIQGEDRIVLSAPAAGGGSPLSPAQAAVVGWILTDGTIEWNFRAGARATIYQSPKKYTKQIETVLSEAGVEYGLYVSSRGLHHYRIRSADLRSLWTVAGLPDGRPDQASLERMLLGLSQAARGALWEAMYLAEGNTGASAAKNKPVIAQRRGAVLEMMRLLIFLQGNHAREWKTEHAHVMKLVAGRPTISAQKGRLQVTPVASQPVWCVETGLDTWVAQQGAEIFLTGNCRVDGAVPSMKGSTDLNGRPIESYEDWQQGVAIVSYKDGDAPFHLELVHINDGQAMFRGQQVSA